MATNVGAWRTPDELKRPRRRAVLRYKFTDRQDEPAEGLRQAPC